MTAGVDLTYTSSPVLPTLPKVILTPSQVTPQSFFFTGLHPQSHPLLYTLATPINYQSSQAGSPQGLAISYTTGQVTWDVNNVALGDYSVQIVVEDAFTGVQVSDVLMN